VLATARILKRLRFEIPTFHSLLRIKQKPHNNICTIPLLSPAQHGQESIESICSKRRTTVGWKENHKLKMGPGWTWEKKRIQTLTWTLSSTVNLALTSVGAMEFPVDSKYIYLCSTCDYYKEPGFYNCIPNNVRLDCNRSYEQAINLDPTEIEDRLLLLAVVALFRPQGHTTRRVTRANGQGFHPSILPLTRPQTERRHYYCILGSVQNA
jgi:hypothetical protein